MWIQKNVKQTGVQIIETSLGHVETYRMLLALMVHCVIDICCM